jgi:PAS domain S-box-containing protein
MTGTRSDFAVLAERSFDAVVTIDEQSTILFANNAIADIFGHSPEEIRGHNLHILIPERLRPQHDRGMHHYLNTGERRISWDGIVLPALHKSGREFEVEIRFGEYRQGERRLFTGYIRPLRRG